METLMQIFAIIGIIISILAVILFVAWAVSFYSSVAIKTFKYNLSEYCRVKNEHIEKKSQARRVRLEKSREQKLKHQAELQDIKLQTKQEIFEIKKRELEMKELAKFEKAKLNAQNRTGMAFDDINHKQACDTLEKANDKEDVLALKAPNNKNLIKKTKEQDEVIVVDNPENLELIEIVDQNSSKEKE